MVTLTIDKRKVTVPEGTTILEAARAAGVQIPTLCYLNGVSEIGACRICCVEVEGAEQLAAACDTPAAEGMVIRTNSLLVREARETNLRLLLSQHRVSCPTCTRNGNCTLQTLCADHNLSDELYEKQLRDAAPDRTAPIIRHDDRCVNCLRCIQICDKVQSMGVWDLLGSGSRTGVGIKKAKRLADTDCTFCGQCVTHCPVGALEERDDTRKVYAALADREKITVVQVAPAVRAAWAEYYGMPADAVTTKQMVTALKETGFDYVFDTNFTADLTIMEEGSEFLQRFTHRSEYSWPMFTSCCPGWVRFVKHEYPELCGHLSTAKSPQQMFGTVAKSYFAEKIGKDPADIFCISVMPCSSKKYECDVKELNAASDKDVDLVLTTREFGRMIKAAGIDAAALPERDFDSPLGTGSGAAVIFGATGGVMEAALRSAHFLITGRNPDADAFRVVRGTENSGIREAEIEIGGAKVRAAVASGLANARILCEEVRSGKAPYDFIEIMACPGGCAGGGGQPIVPGEEPAAERGSRLYELDAANALRFSHENPEVQALYRDYLEKPLSHRAHELLHTEQSEWTL